MATQLSTDRKEPEMAASGEAFGEDYPATHTRQPDPTSRRMPLSYEAFGEDQPGIVVPVDWLPPQKSETCEHSDS